MNQKLVVIVLLAIVVASGILPSTRATVPVAVAINPPSPAALAAFTIVGDFVGYGSGVHWIMDFGTAQSLNPCVPLNYGPGFSGTTDSLGEFSQLIPGQPAGIYTVTVRDEFGDNSGRVCFTIYPRANTITSAYCSPFSVALGSSSSCTVTVFGASGTISGETITWSQSGSGAVTFPSGVTCTLSGTSCSVTVDGSTAGSVTLKASYPGDGGNLPSSGTGGLMVTPTTTSSSVNCSPSTINVGASSSCTATVSGAFGNISGETITWSQIGGTGVASFSPGNTCNLSGASCSVTVTGSSAGSVTVKASYPGDANNSPSSDTGGLTVNAESTTSSVNCSPSAIDVGGSTSSCTATVSGAFGSISGETITFSQSGGTGSVGFPSGNTCNLSGTSCSVTVSGSTIGSVTVKASYPGDTNNQASSVTGGLTVNSMLVAPTVSISQYTITQGQSVTLTSTPVMTGTPPYSYQWFVKGPTDSSFSPIPGATSSSYTFTTNSGTQLGTWMFQLTITDSDPATVTSNAISVTLNPLTPPIPEYPLGLPLLTFLTIIAYGIIKRRTKKRQ